MKSTKSKRWNTNVNRPMTIVAAAAAAGLVSVLMVAAQTTLPLPACNRFDDPTCHPAPPVVTKKATVQTLQGALNVTGQLCVGVGANQVCLPGSTSGAGSTGAVYPGALTVFKQPIVIPEGSWVRDQKVLFNVRNFLTSTNGADPGPVKAVVLSAQVAPVLGVPSLLGAGRSGPTFYASNGDLNYNLTPLTSTQYPYVLPTGIPDSSFQLNSSAWQTVCYPSGVVQVCSSNLTGDTNTSIVPLNASSTMLLGFYSGPNYGASTGLVYSSFGLIRIVGYYN